MANSFVTIFMLLFVLIIPVFVGVYVYRDARRRQMNAALWTLVAVLAPSLVGFIIYLLVRGSYSDLKCPQCGGQVREEYLVCPRCGAKLKGSCSSCGAAFESDWKVCPHCANPIDQTDEVTPPVRRKDRALWKLLLLFILVPILLIVLVFGLRFGTSSGATNMGRIDMTSYLEEKDNEEIFAWLDAQMKDAHKRMDQVYAIRYKTTSGDEKAAHYLIYIPGTTEVTQFDFQRRGFAESVVDLDFNDSGVGSEPVVFTLSVYGSMYPTLTITYNGDRKAVNLWDFEINPCLFEIKSEETSTLQNTTVHSAGIFSVTETEVTVPEPVEE